MNMNMNDLEDKIVMEVSRQVKKVFDCDFEVYTEKEDIVIEVTRSGKMVYRGLVELCSSCHVEYELSLYELNEEDVKELIEDMVHTICYRIERA